MARVSIAGEHAIASNDAGDKDRIGGNRPARRAAKVLKPLGILPKPPQPVQLCGSGSEVVNTGTDLVHAAWMQRVLAFEGKNIAPSPSEDINLAGNVGKPVRNTSLDGPCVARERARENCGERVG